MWCFRFLWSRNIYICLIFFFSQVILSIIFTVYSLDHNWMNCTQDLYYCLSSSRIFFSDLLGAVCLLNFARRTTHEFSTSGFIPNRASPPSPQKRTQSACKACKICYKDTRFKNFNPCKGTRLTRESILGYLHG